MKVGIGESVRHKESCCLGCGKKVDASFKASDQIDSNEPREGAITICFDCGHVMSYNADLTLRELTGEEMVQIAGHPLILALQAARGKVQEERAMKARGSSTEGDGHSVMISLAAKTAAVPMAWLKEQETLGADCDRSVSVALSSMTLAAAQLITAYHGDSDERSSEYIRGAVAVMARQIEACARELLGLDKRPGEQSAPAQQQQSRGAPGDDRPNVPGGKAIL